MNKTIERWLIVSNRLPFKVDETTNKIKTSSGGLVTAISGITTTGAKKLWIGSAPSSLSLDRIKEISAKDKKFSEYIPLYIDEVDYDAYYNCVSNDVLWPLFHYESHIPQFRWEEWKLYEKVNLLFAQKISSICQKGDLVWIHDFHLFLVPQLLRNLAKNIRIGFFLHIPFPSSELLRQLPVARQIMEGILGADLIGFHEYSYLRHFRHTVRSILNVDSTLLEMKYQSREIKLGIFPVSIETSHFMSAARSKQVKQIASGFQKNDQHLLLGVDRLDYTKGIDLKLKAFCLFLRKYKNRMSKKVSLMQVAVPTRRDVPFYMQLKKEIEQLVGEINGEFGEPNYTPIQYLYTSVDFENLLALYRAADVLLVTSKRDGMNLVTLEYIASQNKKNPGAVILSEFAGVASILPYVFMVNPWDIISTATTIYEVLKLTNHEKIQRQAPMLQYLKGYTGKHWADAFMQSLVSLSNVQKTNRVISVTNEQVVLPREIEEGICQNPCILFLDYDGTLAPITSKPDQALMSPTTRNILKKLTQNNQIKVVILSGRKKSFLFSQFRSLKVDLAWEHGIGFSSYNSKKIISLLYSDIQSWYSMAVKIMSSYSSHVPESYVEKKEYSISWHYRNSPQKSATFQANRLAEELNSGLANLPVTVIHGKKIIEIKAIEANKGGFIKWYLSQKTINTSSCLLAIGDDKTDEDMFQSLPHRNGFSVKVGESPTLAKYTIPSQDFVNSFLSKIEKASSGFT